MQQAIAEAKKMFSHLNDRIKGASCSLSIIESEAKKKILKELIERLEALPQDNGWISIEDRLPELYTLVITCDNVGYVGDGMKFPTYWEVKGSRKVTHWQPLPLPPKN